MDDDKHEKALDLTEQALEKLEKGDKPAAETLIEQARKIDPSAPAEIVADMDEDAANHDRE